MPLHLIWPAFLFFFFFVNRYSLFVLDNLLSHCNMRSFTLLSSLGLFAHSSSAARLFISSYIGTVSTVDSVDSAPLDESECTAVRCVRQFAAETDEVLQRSTVSTDRQDGAVVTYAANTPVSSCTSNAESP